MTRDQISKAIQAADDAFGYSADLIRLVDGVATFRLALAGETVEFTDTDEATAAEQYTARVTEARNQARADAVLAALEGEREGWKTIDSAPKDGISVLLFSPDAARTGLMIGYFAEFEGDTDPGTWSDDWSDQAIDAAPTYWRPLPAAPDGDTV